MSEHVADGPGGAWTELGDDEYARCWAAFESRFGFRAGISAESWPAISEPAPSITFDLGAIGAGARRDAAVDAINAEALRAFVWSLPDDELVVLDWHHPAYRFRPAVQAREWHAEWTVPVFPNGDYYAFLTPDLAHGTFGHPWEETLCVLGDRLGASLARTLACWLPVKRRDGVAV
jgi:hypothetical protein